MPIVPESPISVFNFLPSTETQINSTLSNLTSSNNDIYDKIQPTQDDIEIDQYTTYPKDHQRSQNALSIPSVKDNGSIADKYSKTIKILSIIWFTGFLVMIVGYIIIQFRFRKKITSFTKLRDLELVSIVDKCKKIIGIKSEVYVYISDDFKSPCITGVFRPKIYIPKGIETRIGYDQFQHVILHELTHYKRKDLLYNILAIVDASIHWFNPLIWMVIKKEKIDRELACDAYVLELLGEEEAVSYGMTIIKVTRLFLTNQNRLGFASFLGTTGQLERRINMIRKFRKNSFKMRAIAIVGSIIVSGAVLTNPVNANENIFITKLSNQKVEAVSKDSGKEKKFIIDAYEKEYKNLDSLESDVDFKFKVPDFLPPSYAPCSLWLISNNRIECGFDSTDNRNSFYFDLHISKEDPAAYLKEEAERSLTEVVSRKPLQLGNIKSESLETKRSFSNDNSEEKILPITKKYFVFKLDSMFYAIEYMRYRGDELEGEISLADIQKMVESIENPKDIKNINYAGCGSRAFDIYDIEDVKNARKALGFNFKLPLETPHGDIGSSYILEDSLITRYYGSDVIEVPIKFTQSKEMPKYYKQFKEKGLLVLTNRDKSEYNTAKGELVTINNKEVFKEKLMYGSQEGGKGPYIDLSYRWQEDDIYYSINFVVGDKTISDIDEYIKFFMDAKAVDNNLIK
jgi:bla regulator protein BlaR1